MVPPSPLPLSENRSLLSDDTGSPLGGSYGRTSKRCYPASGVMNNLIQWPIRGTMQVPSHLDINSQIQNSKLEQSWVVDPGFSNSEHTGC